MKNSEELKGLVETIILLHETNSFNELASYISDDAKNEDSWFSEKRFYEVCEAINKELGNMVSLTYISSLKRKSTTLTLWKATYNKNKDEVLWQIIFDSVSNKIQLLHINWEQI